MGAGGCCPSAVTLQHPLLMELGIVPAGKGEALEGPISLFTEQAKRVTLKLRGVNQ